MSGFINNYYYGKAGRADYTPEQMPNTRPKLFFEMLRVHFGGLMGVNLLYLVFCLPALAWTLLNFSALIAGVPEADAVGAEEAARVSGLLFNYLLLMIPCLGIAGVGAPGLMYVLRNWARDQHSFMFSDFKDNVKANWKQGLLAGLIGGVLLFCGYVGWRFYGQMSAQSMMFLLPQALVFLVCAIWWMMNMLIYAMMVTYDMKFSQLVRNSAIILIARLPWSILFFAGSLLIPLGVFFIGHMYGIIGMALFYLLVGFALTGFAYASYANSCFDRFLNPRIEGAPVNMGLRDPSLDEEDADDSLPPA